MRYDRIDKTGGVSFRRGGRRYHLGIGRTHCAKPVLALADERAVSVIEMATGEVLSTHEIDPGRAYWRNREQPPDWRPDARE